MKRIGVCGDLHLPWADPIAVELTMRVFKDSKVDQIILNGDIGDLYHWNSHGPVHPDVKTSAQDEIDSVHLFLTILRQQFPKIPIHYIMGNHEDRYDRDVVKTARKYYDKLKFAKELHLDSLNITYQAYNSYYEIIPNKLRVMHSPPSYSENAAKVSLRKKVDCTYIYGCTHRPDYAQMKTSTGKIVECYMLGWLGHIGDELSESWRVFHYRKGHDTWGKSAAIIDVAGEEFSINHFMIKNNKILTGGKLYEI